MAVAFDAVGPSAAGVSSTASTTLSWTHTNVASGVALVVAVAVGKPTDTGFTVSVKLDPAGANTTMTALGTAIHSNNSTGGFIQLFGLPNVSSGAHTITATAAGGTPSTMEGGSVSYTGADLVSPFSAQQSATGVGTAASKAFTGSTSGNRVFGGAACGSDFTGITSGTSRWSVNVDGTTQAGNEVGGDIAGGGSVTLSWTNTSDSWAVVAVEVLSAGGAGASFYPRPPVFPSPRLIRTGSLRPLQLAGDRSTSGTPTSVNLSDTGTGSDALTVSATIALSDTGTGSDALTVSATIGLSDTGTGSDALTVTVTTPFADTGTGSDSLAVTAAIPAADTGTGSDSLSVNGSIPVGDTGSGSDGLSIAATVPFSDTGSGSDALVVDAPGVTDPYQAGQQIAWMFLDLERSSLQSLGSAEAAASTTPNLPDSGLATDGLVVTATVSLSDTGTGADALSVTAAVSLSDTGTGTDTLSVIATVALSDTGAGSDSLSVNATIGLGDTGSGSDSLSAAATVPLADTGTGTDALTITVTAPLSDTATGADVLTALDASQPDPYQATIRTEGWNLLRPSPVTLQSLGDRSGSALIALSDTGTSSDALSVDVSLPGSDTGTGSDSLSITAATALTDAGTATDSLSITATVSLSDTATAADLLAAVRVFTTSDTGTGADALVAFVAAPLSETASGVEALAITAAGSLVEIATAADALSVAIFVPKSLPDTAVAVETMSIFVGLVGGTLTGGQMSGASVTGSAAQESKIVGQVRSGYVTGGVR